MHSKEWPISGCAWSLENPYPGQGPYVMMPFSYKEDMRQMNLRQLAALLIFPVLFQGCATLTWLTARPSGLPVDELSTNILEPEGIIVDSKGAVFVTSEAWDGAVYQIDGSKQDAIIKHMDKPDGLLVDPDGNLLISLETPVGEIYRLRPGGEPELLIEDLVRPEGMAFDKRGRLFIAEDRTEGRILVWDGKEARVWAEGLIGPENLAFDDAGNLFVTESDRNQLVRFTPRGERENIGSHRLTGPDALAYCDAYGGLFVAEDVKKGKLFFVYPDGRMILLMKNLKFPQGVACDPHANLLVTEQGRNRILRIPAKSLKAKILQLAG